MQWPAPRCSVAVPAASRVDGVHEVSEREEAQRSMIQRAGADDDSSNLKAQRRLRKGVTECGGRESDRVLTPPISHVTLWK